jgi:hypothetical protein
MKNNNPGNLENGPFIFVGEKTISDDVKYKQFYELVYGVRALFKQIQLLITVGHNDTKSIINLWSGESKDKTKPFLEFVLNKTQIPPDKKITMQDNDDIKKLGAAIYEYESGEKPRFNDIESGYELLVGNKIL